MAVKTITDTKGNTHEYDNAEWRYHSTDQGLEGTTIALWNDRTKKSAVHTVEGDGSYERRMFS